MTALVTGATTGIGAEFARRLALQGEDLVLVARDEKRLTETADNLAATYGVRADALVADLLTPAGLEAVATKIGADPTITTLVNNAGFGLTTPFHASSITDEQRHLEILVGVPMHLTHAALQAMLPRKSGTIINIASVAAFTPRGSYGAAKAWVVSFSRWANIYYGPQGVTVTAVCPGFVRTEFHQRMGARVDNIPQWMWLTPERVAAEGLADAARGKAVSIPSRRYKVVSALSTRLPQRLVAASAKRGR